MLTSCRAALARPRSFLRRHRAAVTVAGTLLVAGALAVGLAGERGDFAAALRAAPIWILGVAVALHVFWLVARSEAWHVCIGAAEGTVGRRPLYRAASLGYLGNLFNAHIGTAVRIAALRRSAPKESPRAPVLIAAELPIVVIEASLAALLSFTLVGPMGWPWWTPLLALAIMISAVAGLRLVARRRRHGFWKGLAVLRGLADRNRIIALIVVALFAQTVRNWLVLNGVGVEASFLDSIALLIGLALFSLLPIGPSVGPATAVVILGASGVALVAAAGTLLTVTAVIGALCFASWALVDRLHRQPPAAPAPISA